MCPRSRRWRKFTSSWSDSRPTTRRRCGEKATRGIGTDLPWHRRGIAIAVIPRFRASRNGIGVIQSPAGRGGVRNARLSRVGRRRQLGRDGDRAPIVALRGEDPDASQLLADGSVFRTTDITWLSSEAECQASLSESNAAQLAGGARTRGRSPVGGSRGPLWPKTCGVKVCPGAADARLAENHSDGASLRGGSRHDNRCSGRGEPEDDEHARDHRWKSRRAAEALRAVRRRAGRRTVLCWLWP
jgi:hypothetical protein